MSDAELYVAQPFGYSRKRNIRLERQQQLLDMVADPGLRKAWTDALEWCNACIDNPVDDFQLQEATTRKSIVVTAIMDYVERQGMGPHSDVDADSRSACRRGSIPVCCAGPMPKILSMSALLLKEVRSALADADERSSLIELREALDKFQASNVGPAP